MMNFQALPAQGDTCAVVPSFQDSLLGSCGRGGYIIIREKSKSKIKKRKSTSKQGYKGTGKVFYAPKSGRDLYG